MTMERLKAHIIEVCEKGEIPVRMIRKAKKRDGYYVYHENGKTSLVMLNDFDYYTVGNMLKNFGCTKPMIIRVF